MVQASHRTSARPRVTKDDVSKEAGEHISDPSSLVGCTKMGERSVGKTTRGLDPRMG